MIYGIITHTPLWVWPLLAFLLYRGWQASRGREAGWLKTLTLPAIMCALSVWGLLASSGEHPLAALLGLAALSMAALLVSGARATATLRIEASGCRIVQRGSWYPLLLTLGIFTVKYGVAVALALHPWWRGQSWFVVPQALSYGAFAGIFAGRLLQIGHLYRRARADARQALIAASQAGT